MARSSRWSLTTLGLAYTLIASGCAVQRSQSPNVVIPGTSVLTLGSQSTGRGYDIYIRLPEGWDAGAPTATYPVLYVLDGQWDFKLLDSIYGGLFYDEFVPQMVIIGITYAGADANYDMLRAMDYTPVRTAGVRGSGDAPKFLAFLTDELFPRIESDYRIDPTKRVLMGSSFGGSFTLYALFSEPTLFAGYVAASPAVTYGSRAAFVQEATYARDHRDLPVRLFLSVGDQEPLYGPVAQFMETVRARNYEGLVLETRIIEGERHAGNKPEAYNRGLRFIFQDW